MLIWNLINAIGSGAAGDRAGDWGRDIWDWTRGGGGRRDRDGRDRDGRNDRGVPRPPGPEPPSNPPSRNPRDPPTLPDVPPGLNPRAPGPKPIPPEQPKKPPIPDEREILIDLSKDFNPIRSQDGLGACTAFAATSIFEYILHVGYKMPKRYLSPLFLWYKTRETIDEIGENTGPSTCTVPMQNLVDGGVCFEELWSFVEHTDEKWLTHPDQNAVIDAFQKKLITFRSLNRYDYDQWIHELNEDNPINIAIYWQPDMHKPYKKKLYDNYDVMDYTKRDTGYGHAMVIVGYHSHYPYQGKGIKAFKIRNTHDIDWGDNGYIWIPAEILVELLNERPLVITGWNKDSKGQLKKRKSEHNLKENKEILEHIKKYVEKEKEWLGAEYEYLRSLKKCVVQEKYQGANRIMSSVGRSEYVVEGFEQRIEDDLSDLMHNMQEPYISAIGDIKVNLKALAGTLVKLTSRYAGDLRRKLNEVIEDSSKEDEKYQLNKNSLKEMIDEAIHTVRGLVTELDRLLNLEEEILRNQSKG